MLEFVLIPLLKMIGFDYKNKRAKDRALLEQFLELLPSDSDTIYMLKETDMGSLIPRSYFTPLYYLQKDWHAPDKEFQVRKIEKLKISFIDAVDQLLSEYSKHCRSDGHNLNIGINDLENRKEVLEYQENLNKLAINSFKKYDRFVRYARKEI